VRQGVTLEVIGQCGASAAPRSAEEMKKDREKLAEYGIDRGWRTMEEYLSLIEARGVSVNVAALVGHGNVRRVAMGHADRQPTEAELNAMKDLVREAMEAGAFGMSSGLIYPPGAFADTAELIELSRVVGEYGGMYVTHMRDEGTGLLNSIEETLTIGREAGVGVQISHHKATGKNAWGLVNESLRAIEKARREGLDVTCDQYPYIATSTGLTSVIPNWAHEGGHERLAERLRDPETRAKLRAEMQQARQDVSGWENIVVARLSSDENRKYIGKSIADIAEDWGKDPCETTFELLLAENLEVGQVHFCLSEDDVKVVMAHPTVMPGSDASALATEGPLSKGQPHPRAYGTFPRILGKYVREENTLTLAEAVRKMTSLPARKLGLFDRGILRPSMKADIVVFDPDTVQDAATFTDPHRYPVGIRHVVVNGSVVIDNGEHSGARPGRVIRRP